MAINEIATLPARNINLAIFKFQANCGLILSSISSSKRENGDNDKKKRKKTKNVPQLLENLQRKEKFEIIECGIPALPGIELRPHPNPGVAAAAAVPPHQKKINNKKEEMYRMNEKNEE